MEIKWQEETSLAWWHFEPVCKMCLSASSFLRGISFNIDGGQIIIG
jgi:hypothetical protein